MTLKILIIPFLFFTVLPALAQSQRQKIKFQSISQVGLLTGSRGEALSVQTISGIRAQKWFAGLGVGLDFYADRTIPLFVDVRRDFTVSKNRPFIYAAAGTNFFWLNQAQKQLRSRGLSYSNPPGPYYDIGLGLKLAGKNGRGLIFSAGYSFKQVKETVKINWGAPTQELQEQNVERYNYLYRRIMLKIGFDL